MSTGMIWTRLMATEHDRWPQNTTDCHKNQGVGVCIKNMWFTLSLVRERAPALKIQARSEVAANGREGSWKQSAVDRTSDSRLNSSAASRHRLAGKTSLLACDIGNHLICFLPGQKLFHIFRPGHRTVHTSWDNDHPPAISEIMYSIKMHTIIDTSTSFRSGFRSEDGSRRRARWRVSSSSNPSREKQTMGPKATS